MNLQALNERLAAENAQLQLAIQRIERDTIERCAKAAEETELVDAPLRDQQYAQLGDAMGTREEIAKAIRSLSSKQQDKTDLGHEAVNLADSAIAPSSCGSVPRIVALDELDADVDYLIGRVVISPKDRAEVDLVAEAIRRKIAIAKDEITELVDALSTTSPMLQARTDAHDEGQPHEQNAVCAPLQATAPAGMKLVPIEPTLEMIERGDWAHRNELTLRATYKAMIAAAEEPKK